MFSFRTTVDLPFSTLEINEQTRCLFVGSCFATEISRRAAADGVLLTTNPTGTLYNMESIREALLAWCEGNDTLESLLFFGRDELWHSPCHSSIVDAPAKEECIGRVLAADALAQEAYRRAEVVFVTAGTTHLYRRKTDGMVVANCHKEPSLAYTEEIQRVEDIVKAWLPLLQTMAADGKRVVFTVSPYRYAKYGFHANNLSKSTLLLAIDELCARFSHCSYFPAYEIVLDELRDYRFFSSDMLHVSDVAADYIYERFKTWCFTPQMHALAKDYHTIAKRLTHRPREANSNAYEDFCRETERLKGAFQERWKRPFVLTVEKQNQP